ncbi:MAG: hypothetical protein ACRDC4_00370 [Plesiomonas sp.]
METEMKTFMLKYQSQTNEKYKAMLSKKNKPDDSGRLAGKPASK